MLRGGQYIPPSCLIYRMTACVCVCVFVQAIDMVNQEVRYYDSLKGPNPECLDLMRFVTATHFSSFVFLSS